MSCPSAAVAAGLLEEGGTLSMQPSRQGLVPVVCISRSTDRELGPLSRHWGGLVEELRAAGEQPGLWRWMLAGRATEPFLRWIAEHLSTMAGLAELAVRGAGGTHGEREAVRREMEQINRAAHDPAPTGQFVARLVGRTSWEGAQMSLLGSGPSASFSGTWPRSGWMRAGVCYERTRSVRPIGELAGSVLRTPLASLGDGSGGMSPEVRRRRGQGPSLADEVEYLMTERSTTG